MRIVLFCHSLISDWSNPTAPFIRGFASELAGRGMEIALYEPRNSWSATHLIRHHGTDPLRELFSRYPHLESIQHVRYDPKKLALEECLAGADLVWIHGWGEPPGLVDRIVRFRQQKGGFRLFYFESPVRPLQKDDQAVASLRGCDAVLAGGRAVAERVRGQCHADRLHLWYEAADTRVFQPVPNCPEQGDLVWIGNWGEGERKQALQDYLLAPTRELSTLKAHVYGVRYPIEYRPVLRRAGVDYRGWIPNYRVPEVYSGYRVAIHIPDGPGPSVRLFEALACGIPLVSAPGEISGGDDLFVPGRDYWSVQSPEEMTDAIRTLLVDPARAAEMASRGRRTVLEKHTCSHRVDELLSIHRALEELDPMPAREPETIEGSLEGIL